MDAVGVAFTSIGLVPAGSVDGCLAYMSYIFIHALDARQRALMLPRVRWEGAIQAAGATLTSRVTVSASAS